MKNNIMLACLVLAISFLKPISATAQLSGDFGAVASGDYSNTTTVWKKYSTTTNSFSSATSSTPTSSSNVYIPAGITVTISATSQNCTNMYVQNGGTLTIGNSTTASTLNLNGNLIVSAGGAVNTASTTSSVQNVISLGTSGLAQLIQIDGTLGDNNSNHLINLVAKTANSVITVNSSLATPGAAYFCVIKPNAAGITFNLDRDLTLTNSAVALCYSNATSTGYDGTIVNIAAGKTTTLSTGSAGINTSSVTPPTGGGNGTLNINGTLTIAGSLNLKNVAGKTFNLNVNTGGALNIGKNFNVPAGNGSLNVAVASGAVVNFTSGSDSCSIPAAVTTMSGTWNFDSTLATTRSIGTASVDGKLQFSDNVFPSGITLNTASTVEYRGSTAYTLPASPSVYTNVNLKNKGGLTLGAATTVNGVMLVDSGTLITGANDLTLGAAASAVFSPGTALSITGGTTNFAGRPVTLQSSALATASVGTITGVLSNATNVTVQRYIPSNSRKSYILVTSPVSSPTIYNAWQEGGATTNTGYGTQITGAASSNGFDAASASGFPSIFTYNDANTTGKWVGLTNTNVNTLAPAKGYLLYVRGDRSEARYTTGNSGNTTLRATGTLTTGNFTPVLTTTLADKFNLVANPYASAITWTGLTRNNITGSFYVFDPNVGIFFTSNGTTVSPAGTGTGTTQQRKDTIQSGQAFFIQNASAGTPSITFTESAKVGTGLTASSNTVFGGSSAPSQLNVNVYNKSNELADGVVALFGNDYKAGLGKEDAAKMDNFNETFSLTRNNNRLSIEGRPMVTGNDTLFFAMSNFGKKEYVLQIDGSNFSESNATLIDNYTGTKTPLDLAGITAYNFAVNSDAASYDAGRFMIVLGNTIVLPATDNVAGSNLVVKLSPNPVSDRLLISFKTNITSSAVIRIVNSLGQEVKTVNAGKVNAASLGISVNDLPAGIYTVQLVSGNEMVASQKIVKQ